MVARESGMKRENINEKMWDFWRIFAYIPTQSDATSRLCGLPPANQSTNSRQSTYLRASRAPLLTSHHDHSICIHWPVTKNKGREFTLHSPYNLDQEVQKESIVGSLQRGPQKTNGFLFVTISTLQPYPNYSYYLIYTP